MKCAIIYIIDGNDPFYKFQLQNSLKTLLKQGQYTGDIIILTGKQFDEKSLLEFPVKIKKCLKDNISIYCQRIYIDQYVDLTIYSHILYLDVDTLFHKDVSELFNADHLLFVEEYKTIRDCTREDLILACTKFFTQDELKLLMDCRAINNGQFVLPIASFRDFFQQWQSILGSYSGWGYDQSSFNALVRRNEELCQVTDRVSLYDNIHDETIMSHHICSNALRSHFNRYILQCDELIDNLSFNENILHNKKLK